MGTGTQDASRYNHSNSESRVQAFHKGRGSSVTSVHIPAGQKRSLDVSDLRYFFLDCGLSSGFSSPQGNVIVMAPKDGQLIGDGQRN